MGTWAQSQPFKQLVDWSRGRQTHKLIGVIKRCKCQERIFKETGPKKGVSNLCGSDDDKKILKNKMTLKMEFEG